MRDMRREVDPDGDLVAYWKFNDLDEDKSTFVEHEVTKDASGASHDSNSPWEGPRSGDLSWRVLGCVAP